MSYGIYVYRDISFILNTIHDSNLVTACICLSNSYFWGNNQRKTVVKACLEKGFKKVIFLEVNEIPYFVAIKFSFYIPKNDDVIWIFNGSACFVYHRTNEKAKFICQCNDDYSKPDILKTILKESKYIPNNCLFYSDDEKINKNVIEKIFPLCKCHILLSTLRTLRSSFKIVSEFSPWDFFTVMDFAGIKTQNIKKKFDTYDILNRSITVEYNNQKILEISKFQSLPFKVFYKVTNTINNSHIYVDEEEKRLFSFKKYETFKVPENLKNFNIFFKVDHNGIYSIKYLSSPVFSISGNYVIIYDIQNEETYTFNATTDYGLNVPIMNVSYKSVTTISEPFKCFEREYKNDTIIATEFVFENFTDYFYMIKVNANEKPVSTKKVVTDIIRYGITQYRIPNDYCIVTFPPHLSERQKQVFMKCVENAESKDSIFVDEQIALAYGCEKEYNLPTDAFYIIVHYSDPKICISLVKVGLEFDKEYERILFEAEDFELSIDRLFDHIIDNNNASSNNFEDMLDNCLLSICNLLETKTIYSIYVTRESLLFSIISEFFPKIQTSFIKFPEKIIAKGALYGCDITEDV